MAPNAKPDDSEERDGEVAQIEADVDRVLAKVSEVLEDR